MAAIHDNVLSIVGKTPIVRLAKIARDLPPTVLAKLEFLNPGGSVKDRIGITMIEDAERRGLLKPGGTIIEGTSGNTGVGLAIAAAIKGYKCIFTMPDKMSQEKINLLRAFGAEVIITPTAVPPDDPRSYYSVAKRLAREIPNSYYPNQYDNLANPETHYRTTGPEIWEQTDGKIDVAVISMGTGGTITGIGKYLKEKNPKIRVVGVDPVGSIYTEYFRNGLKMPANPYFKTYKVEGIGEDIIPKAIDFAYIDDVVQVGDRESFLTARRLCREEGLFAGGSSGTVLAGALEVARSMGKGQVLLTLLPDSGSRYLSTFYRDEWMRQHQFMEEQVTLTAADVLKAKPSARRELISVRSTDKVLFVIGRLKELDFSQLPVIDEGQVVGTIMEDQMIDVLINNPKVGDLIVGQVMQPALPIVEESAGVSEIYDKLRRGSPAVLVKRAGSLGIITKSDLIHTASEAR